MRLLLASRPIAARTIITRSVIARTSVSRAVITTLQLGRDTGLVPIAFGGGGLIGLRRFRADHGQDVPLVGHDVTLAFVGDHQLSREQLLSDDLAGPLLRDNGRSHGRKLLATLFVSVELVPQTALQSAATTGDF